MTSFFRIQPADEDPEALLDPEHQRTTPWSGAVRGRCDKCRGSGETEPECESCKAGPPDDDCPACGGKVRYREECPACDGSGEIDDSSRKGVSVFPDLDGLYRYMAGRHADLDGCVLVELAGRPSEDEDFDADEGALLVRPSRVIGTGEVDKERVAELRDDSRRRVDGRRHGQ